MAKTAVNPENQRWLKVLGDAMPLCLSYIPIGLACGILLHASGFNFIMILLISCVVFSGGAQFILASLMLAHSTLLTIFLTLFFLEMRYALLGSSLSRYIHDESQRFVFIFAISMNDENYAVNYLKFVTDKHWTPKDALMVEHYSLITWSVSNMVGALIGYTVHIDLEIVDFALTALFIYMIVTQLRDHLKVLMALFSAVLAVIFLVITKSTLGIIIATLIASLTGFAIENHVVKHNDHPHHTWILGKTFQPESYRHTAEDEEVLEEEDEVATQEELSGRENEEPDPAHVDEKTAAAELAEDGETLSTKGKKSVKTKSKNADKGGEQ